MRSRSPEAARDAHGALTDALARAGADLAQRDVTALLGDANGTPALLAAAAARRDRAWGRTVTYSPKVFLPVTNLCRDRCTYCTFRKDPGEPGAWTMRPEEIAAWSARGRRLGCTEALVCLGDRPEAIYPAYRALLTELGHDSTAAYVHRACRLALDAGLLPHANAGVLARDELAMLRNVNVSMGLMLESTSERLRGRGQVHQWSPDKAPAARLRMLRDAGELRIPFTTGLLLGIGETLAERVDTLVAIRDLHRAHGHIQEIIIQPFRAKPGIPLAGAPEPSALDLARTVALARLLLDDEVSIQAPPNLAPQDLHLLLAAGVNDWGGLSPLTPDYVNPEAPWPHVTALAETCRAAGFGLAPRLPVYPRFITRPGWLAEPLRAAVAAHEARMRPAAAATEIRPA